MKKYFTSEETNHYIKLAQEGNIIARDKIVMNFQDIIKRVANKVLRKHSFEFEDLMQVGNIALLRAIERYDFRSDCKFITMINEYIYRQIMRELIKYGKMIRLPNHLYQLINNLRKVVPENSEENLIHFLINNPDYPSRDILLAGLNVKKCLSLDSAWFKINDNDNEKLEDILTNNDLTPEEMYFQDEMMNDIKEIVFRCYGDRNARIFLMRYFSREKIVPMEEIGKHFNLTRQRVEQILRKMKTNPELRFLLSQKIRR